MGYLSSWNANPIDVKNAHTREGARRGETKLTETEKKSLGKG